MRLFPLAVAALGVFTLAAHADPLSFTLNETFTTGSASGTVTIDTTTGTFSSANYSVSYMGNTYNFLSGIVVPSGTVTALESLDTTGTEGNLLALPTSTLVGYTGSLLCPTGFASACLDPGTSSFYTSAFGTTASPDNLISGSLTLPSSVSATPEPSSIALLGTGLMGIAGVVRKRFA